MRLFKIMVAVLAVTAGTAGHGQGKQVLAPQPNISDATARVAAAWSSIVKSGFSGAVRIDLGDTVVLRAGAGFADPVKRRRFAPDDQFEIGSLTKPFTAAAILKLQDEGKLSVQDPLSKFFPDAPADKAPITLHQLLTHSAGFPLVSPPVATQSDLEPIGRKAFVARAFAAPLMFKPGARIEYSNTGYGLLAAIVELASGKPYEDYLRAKILAPVGAMHTGYGAVFQETLAARTPKGETIRDCCWGPGGPYWNLVGNGGLVSTLDDFVGWRKAFAAGRVVSAAAVTQAGTGWVPERSGSGKEGYGWIIGHSPTHGRVEAAAGGNQYFVTEMRYYPDYGVTSLVTSNGDQSPGVVASELLAAVFDEPPPQSQALVSPGSPGEAALMEAFSTAVLSPDLAARRSFLDKNVGPVFREREGFEAIVIRFEALHAELGSATRTQASSDMRGGGKLTFADKQAKPHVIAIDFGGTPDAPKIAGFSKSE